MSLLRQSPGTLLDRKKPAASIGEKEDCTDVGIIFLGLALGSFVAAVEVIAPHRARAVATAGLESDWTDVVPCGSAVGVLQGVEMAAIPTSEFALSTSFESTAVTT
jgi:hypothetical protein